MDIKINVISFVASFVFLVGVGMLIHQVENYFVDIFVLLVSALFYYVILEIAGGLEVK